MTGHFSIPDVRVLPFTSLAALATGIGFGLAPALQATRLDQTSALKDGVSASPRQGVSTSRFLSLCATSEQAHRPSDIRRRAVGAELKPPAHGLGG